MPRPHPHASTHRLLLRLRVVDPPHAVPWAVQLGRSDLLAPVRRDSNAFEFEIPLELVTTADAAATVRGPAVQGPRGARFVYLTSGKRAGDLRSPWDRRAKISLETLPIEAIRARPADRVLALDGEIHGTAKDGGPSCASVRLIGGSWVLSPPSE